MKKITQEYLKSVLHYNGESGLFTWLKSRGARRSGSCAGCDQGDGYLRIGLRGKLYLAHRLAWFWMTGGWPVSKIDHRDLNGLNNRWKNLREATDSQNRMNTYRRSDNTSGFKGVHWQAPNEKWQARIITDGKRQSLGLFDCAAAAHFAYVVAADKSYGEFARAR